MKPHTIGKYQIFKVLGEYSGYHCPYPYQKNKQMIVFMINNENTQTPTYISRSIYWLQKIEGIVYLTVYNKFN